ncbi:neurogenic locus notch homolog protein 3-like isoform X2 [Penaeus monodon]|uniref:neurogenic locus notch homolog protein 3-like isoform X2 n=1 Tax=Penaeus monodon TaxID=6687 RepID=UPI0018A747B6|nr:neurogenic locus notch homolog protein 3-like isoform X2 [Penaeus monodon]
MAAAKILFLLCVIWLAAADVAVELSCAKDQISEVTNGHIKCTLSRCKIMCNSGYKLKGGKSKIYITCSQDTGQFTYSGRPWRQSAPNCIPHCKKGCQNGGTCVSPNQCLCSPAYRGKNCEARECPEPSFPDAQANFTRTDDDELLVKCHEGYVLPPGTAPGGVAFCREGAWELPHNFRCQHECGNLVCQNGGSCVAPGHCNCAPGFTGENCERHTCPDILALNGNIVVTPVSLEVKCHEGYTLKSGKDAMVAKCQAGEWTVPPEDLQSDTIACIRDCGNLGCQNGGSCVAPGHCNCAPGFTGENCERHTCPDILALNGNIVVTPVSLEVKCHEGYTLKSGKDAMVAKCQAGEWTVPPEDLQGNTVTCIPNCINGCQNGGTCIAPSQCQCSAGYKGKNCEARECPEPSFPDAQASFARTDDDELRVECHEGYVPPPGTAPGELALCKDGAWDLPDDFKCQPNCINGCQNGGTCIAPSQCQCSPGYKGKSCEARECPEPSFPDAQASFARTDDDKLRVECHEGYVPPPGTVPGGVALCKDGAWDLPDDFKCQPNCVNGCQNGGTCIAPSQCQCSPGYKGKNCEARECPEPSFPDAQASFARTDDDKLRVECHEGYVPPPGTVPGGVALCKDGAWDLPDDFKCQPNCINGCQNGGTCIAPSQCQCSPGYKGKSCEARECPEPSFPDAQASFARTDDDELRVECHEGYVPPPGTVPGGVALCKDGAWDLPDDFKCQPNCVNGCQNGGTCIAPNQCQCSPGYKGKNCEARECPEPSFPDAQASFARTDDDKLRVECHAGYVLPPGTVPGGVALCKDGAWDLPDDFKCQTNCINGCQNGGTCIAPSQCQCSPGYKGKNCEARECPEPSFPDAQASFARTDDDELRVECHEGYVLPPGTVPGGVALCKDGAWDLPDDFKCQPSCERPGCQNGGRCVAPNQCQCEDQFTGERCQVRRCEKLKVRAISANLTINDTHLTAECESGYAFPHGGTVSTLHCQDGEWHSEERVVADNSTLECTFQETPCYYPSKTFNNTIMEGDLFSHSLRCPRGFRMRDGRAGVALVCLEAEWTVRGEGPMADLDLNCYPV